MNRLVPMLASAALACGGCGGLPRVEPGDIIFQTSRSSQSRAIQHATGSPYSHMGLVLFRDGKPFVLEAVQTVRYTPLHDWIDRGVGHHYVVKRLVNAHAILTSSALNRIVSVGGRFLGRPYDLTFGWSDDRLYCSELVWKVFDRSIGVDIGKLQRMKDFNLEDPVVRAKLHERFGDRAPLDEPVISPVAMFRSKKLVTVARR